MKKTNKYSYKLAIAATSLVMMYFVSGLTAIAQAAELVNAEPVQKINLTQQAQQSLTLSFSTLLLDTNFTESASDILITKQKNIAKENQSITLAKVTRISE